MYRYEVLAPCGAREGILPIIEAGADAIYVGTGALSSRPSSSDFSMEDIKRGLEECHRHGVKLNVAINGAVSDQRLDFFCQQMEALDALGVDALILADWGALHLAQTLVTHAELHASTLLGTYQCESVRQLADMGVRRTVLSTGLYLDEISSIIRGVPEMEFELVADGGICFNDNRICELPHAGENADYAVYCRKPYHLYKDGRCTGQAPPISAKQIECHEMLDLYLELGIYSFKIEGRTVPYPYILPRVKRLKEGLQRCAHHDHERASTLHYISRMAVRGRNQL